MSDSDSLRPTLTSDRLSEPTDSPTLRPSDSPTLTDSLTDSRPTLDRLSTFDPHLGAPAHPRRGAFWCADGGGLSGQSGLIRLSLIQLTGNGWPLAACL